MKTWIPLLLTLAACSGDGDDPAGSGDTGAPTTPTSWQDMDFEQRTAYMADVVMPTMQAEFEAYDDRFADMNCGTCHGSGADDGSFTMPSDGLYPIDFAAFPTGPGADFMLETVTPMMTDLLDEQPFDPKTGAGFGCLGCHPAAR